MEGKKQDHFQDSQGINVDMDCGQIHEYAFFLTEDEEGLRKVVPEVELEEWSEARKGKKEKERSKSITFFLSE
jgi:hypothetical protein